MKKLCIVLGLLFIVSCASYKPTGINYNFSVSSKKVYHKGIEIGYLDAIKLEKEGDKVRREYSFILYNTSDNTELAPEFIDYLMNDGRFKTVDLEVKFLVE